MHYKYLVMPGYVNSQDGDRHPISSRQVMELYQVPTQLCLIPDLQKEFRGYNPSDIMDLIPLLPDQYGDYINPDLRVRDFVDLGILTEREFRIMRAREIYHERLRPRWLRRLLHPSVAISLLVGAVVTELLI